MIRVKRVYEPASKEDGWRVLVDRLWPRGLTKEAVRADVWLKDAAPSDTLRKWFGHDPKKWTGFQNKYRTEIKKKKGALDALRAMEKEHGTVTLLFGAKDEAHNQAVALAQMLKGRS
ncbi:MAG TPA: DUF488 domain-containing protein [Candidatus Acidoferrum sp.]|nr:DUF488 domain-containing protein [Candidatus Acidoferrum sp.]